MSLLGRCLILGCAVVLIATYACSNGTQMITVPKQTNHHHAWVWPFEPVEAPDEEEAHGPVDDISQATIVCDPHYRWAIKTLADSAAPQVNFTPVPTTIAALRAVPHPTPWPLPYEYPTRIAPFEFTTWQLTNVLLVEIYPPAKDQDYHLFLQDGSGNQFIAEVPNLACAPGTIAGSQFSPIYNYITNTYNFGSPPMPVFPNVVVTVTGVGFFDPYTPGHPPAGQELHPVLSLIIGSPSPSPSPTATPTPSPTPTPSATSSPTPTPSPTPSATSSPTPTPSPTPSTSPSATPTPSPTPTSSGKVVGGTVTEIVSSIEFVYQTGYPHGYVPVLYSESMVVPSGTKIKVGQEVSVTGSFNSKGQLVATSVTVE